MATVMFGMVALWAGAVCTPTGSTFNDATCAGVPYDFNGRQLTVAGTYFDTLQTTGGCDSIVTLNLTVNQPSNVSIYDTICAGTVYYFAGIRRTVSGIYGDTLFNQYFCDSIISLHLTVNNDPHPRDTIRTSTCAGHPYNFYGRNITQPGTYRDTVAGSNHGCDSIIVLVLQVIGGGPGGGTNVTAQICTGGSYDFNGTILTTAGTYRDTLVSATTGCDSIIRLTLTVGSYNSTTKTDSICAGNGSYQWRGRTLTSTGTFRDTVVKGTGCDSIYILRLVAKPGSLVNQNIQFCQGSTVTWHGNTYTAPGQYRDTVPNNTGGCDTVFTLNLQPGPPPTINKTDSICSGDAYVYLGKTYTLAGVYTDTIASNTGGCDTIVRLRLNAKAGSPAPIQIRDSICQGGTYHFRDTSFTTNGVFRVGLAGPGCDTVVTIFLTYRTSVPAVTITQSGTTLIANTTSAVSYQWYFNGNAIPNATGQAYPASGTGSGTYTVDAIDAGGCTGTSAPFNAIINGITAVTETKMMLYPNPNRGVFTLYSENAIGEEAIIADLSGREMARVAITKNNETFTVNNLSEGTYLLQLAKAGSRPIRFSVMK